MKMSKKEENEVKRGIFKSHLEALSQAPIDYPKNLCFDYEVRSIETVVEGDRFVKKGLSKTVHPQDNFKGFKASDFDLESIIAVGALDSLKDCVLSDNSMNIADHVEGSVDNVIAAFDAAEVNNNNGGE